MMTRREPEILEIIKEKPTIEQSELAAMLGITRSSVAVHIANLQKKGYILGRGYIVNNGDYIVGIGAANVDVHGRSKKAINLHDSNPGHMNTSAGGVTRNVSENFARLGGNVKLITAVGDDVYADKICAECTAAGIDISHILKVDILRQHIFRFWMRKAICLSHFPICRYYRKWTSSSFTPKAI